jgi:hypothetical protein
MSDTRTAHPPPPVPSNLSMSELAVGLLARSRCLQEPRYAAPAEVVRTAALMDRASVRLMATRNLLRLIEKAPTRGRKAKKAHKAKVLDMARRILDGEMPR